MPDALYDRLADIFNMIGFGSRKSPELEALLKSLFNEEEANLAVNLSPMAPEAPSQAGRTDWCRPGPGGPGPERNGRQGIDLFHHQEWGELVQTDSTGSGDI